MRKLFLGASCKDVRVNELACDGISVGIGPVGGPITSQRLTLMRVTHLIMINYIPNVHKAVHSLLPFERICLILADKQLKYVNHLTQASEITNPFNLSQLLSHIMNPLMG